MFRNYYYDWTLFLSSWFFSYICLRLCGAQVYSDSLSPQKNILEFLHCFHILFSAFNKNKSTLIFFSYGSHSICHQSNVIVLCFICLLIKNHPGQKFLSKYIKFIHPTLMSGTHKICGTAYDLRHFFLRSHWFLLL